MSSVERSKRATPPSPLPDLKVNKFNKDLFGGYLKIRSQKNLRGVYVNSVTFLKLNFPNYFL
jgi:hypothetical protein